MASPLVCGPGHIFVGIPVAFAADIITLPKPKINNNGANVQIAGPDFVDLQPAPVGPAPLDNGQIASRVVGYLVAASKVPVYLGTAEITPVIAIRPELKRWSDDEGTDDDLYEGETVVVEAALNRYDPGVYEYIVTRTHNTGVGGLTGVDIVGAIGSSMLYEGSSYPLWVQFPLAQKRVYAQQGHPFGYRFFNAYLPGPDRTTPINTDPIVRHCLWVARRYYDPASGVAATYDHDMRGLPLAS